VPEEFKHIVRIAGKDLKGNRSVQMALSDIEGIGVAMARAVAYAANVDPFVKIGSLSKESIKRIEDVLAHPAKSGIPSWMFNRRKDYDTGADIHLIGPDVKMVRDFDISREKRIRSRRGVRHELGLTVRGQRTRTTGRKGLSVGVKRKEIRMREEAAKPKKEKEKKE
jgi:small subunit ribosomal protein S13